MYSMYFLDTHNILINIVINCVLLIIVLAFKYVEDLLDFKKFAKKYYYLDINIFRFTLNLLKYKIENYVKRLKMNMKTEK